MNMLKLKLASLLAALGLGVSVFFGLTPASIEPTVGAQVYLPYQGGTGTGTAPDTGGKLLISTSSNVYTPAYLTAGSNITIASSSGGITISATGGGGSSTFTGLDFGVIGGSQVKITSQSFDAGMFDLSNTASEGYVRLDWTNGPASRSTTNTWSSVNTFSVGASISGSLEVAGTASISGATGSSKALIVNNSTSTGNIFEAQDNGTAVFTIADGGQAQVSNGTNPNLLVSGAGAGGVGGQFGSLRLGSNAGSYTTLDNNYNTGVFSTTNSWSSGTFTWLLGATEKMRINSSGVGIGTSSVDSSFELAGLASISNRSGGTTVAARINGGSSTGSILRLTNEVAGTPAILDFLSTSTMMTLVANNSLRLEAGGSGGAAGYLDLNYGSGLSTWANYSARQKILLNYNAATTTTKNSSYVLTQAIGAGAVGYGNGIALQGNSATVAARDMVRFNGVWTDATDASRTAVIVFDTVTSAGALTEVMRVGNSGASVSTNFEAVGYASSSKTFGSGLAADCLTTNALQYTRSTGLFSCAAVSGGGGVASSSLDFDEFVVNMTLDQNHTIASAGFGLNFSSGGLGVKAGGTINTPFEVGGIASISNVLAQGTSNATPGFAFIGDADTGLSQATGGTNTLGFVVGGTEYAQLRSTTFYINTDIVDSNTTDTFHIEGGGASAGAPTYSFEADQDTGMYNLSASPNVLLFSAGATKIASASLNGWEFAGYASASRVFAQGGSSTVPAFGFGSAKTTGIWGDSSNLYLIQGGSSAVTIGSGYISTTRRYASNIGTVAAPGYTFGLDTTSGMSLTVNNTALNFSNGGVRIASGSSAGWEIAGTASISNVPAISGTSTAVCIEAGGLIEQNTGSPTCTVSSLKYKENVRDLDLGLSDLLKLRAVSFTAKGSGKESIGFIAEEVLKVDERLVFFEADGKDPRGVNYEMFAPWVVEAIQEQQAQINAIAGGQPLGSAGQTLEEQIDSLSVWRLCKLIVIKIFNLHE